MEGLLKQRLVGPTPRVPDSEGLERSLKICISNKFRGSTDTAGPGSTLRTTALQFVDRNSSLQSLSCKISADCLKIGYIRFMSVFHIFIGNNFQVTKKVARTVQRTHSYAHYQFHLLIHVVISTPFLLHIHQIFFLNPMRENSIHPGPLLLKTSLCIS